LTYIKLGTLAAARLDSRASAKKESEASPDFLPLSCFVSASRSSGPGGLGLPMPHPEEPRCLLLEQATMGTPWADWSARNHLGIAPAVSFDCHTPQTVTRASSTWPPGELRQRPNQVCTAYNPDHPAIPQDGDAFDVVLFQHLGNCLDGGVLRDRDNR